MTSSPSPSVLPSGRHLLRQREGSQRVHYSWVLFQGRGISFHPRPTTKHRQSLQETSYMWAGSLARHTYFGLQRSWILVPAQAARKGREWRDPSLGG